MSPHVGNFVADLVEMAKATETLPIVQQELDRAKSDNDSLHAAVQAREEAIQKYKAEIEALQSKVRDTEAQRDDAELRFLELDEKASKVMGVLDLIRTHSTDAKAALEPPKPEPTPEPIAEVVHSIDEQPMPVEQSPYYPAYTEQAHVTPVPPTPTPWEGQSASPPTVNPSPVPASAPTPPATPQDAGTTGGAVDDDKVYAPYQTWEGPREPATPTSAPVAQTGTGQESGTSSSDPEPPKYDTNDHTRRTNEWYSWFYRQPDDYRSSYNWS